jgi:hypothetical protein
MGEAAGVLSDRLPAQCNHADAHQFCLAHLIRDVQYAIWLPDGELFAPVKVSALRRCVTPLRRGRNICWRSLTGARRTYSHLGRVDHCFLLDAFAPVRQRD